MTTTEPRDEPYGSCHSLAPGMVTGDTCPDCGHVAAAHTWPGMVCSACQGLAEVRAAIAELRAAAVVSLLESEET